MQQQEDMELLFWALLDGTADEEQEVRARQLLTLPANQHLFEELKALHATLHTPATEQPSLRFTRNVMEAVEHTLPARKPAQRYYNPWVLGAVAALLLLLALLPGAGSGTGRADATVPLWVYHIAESIQGHSLFLLVPAVLLFFDALLRRRKPQAFRP